MSAVVHRPATREEWLALRRGHVGASEVGALLGVHEYATPYGLWAAKSGLVPLDHDETPAMRRGRLLEPIAIQAIAEEHPGWKLTPNPMPGGSYYCDPDVRLGSTPDLFAIDPERSGQAGIVQIKSVEPSIFRRKWRGDDGEVEPPLWIAVQAMIDAHLTGADWVAVAALLVGHGIEVQIVPVPIHGPLIDRLRHAVADFWRRVEAGEPYPPDYARDGETLAEIYARDNGAEIDLTGDNRLPEILDERDRLLADSVDAAARLREIRAEILAKLGPAASARVAGGRRVLAKTVRRKGYAVAPSSFRQVRVISPGERA